jgi:hypothetical protein
LDTAGNEEPAGISGTYARNYSSALVAPWLWNAAKKVFLSTEDEQSLGTKADYVVSKGLGGIMIWELAGDCAFDSAAGEYRMGSTLTNLWHTKFTAASPYGAAKSNTALPSQTLNVDIQIGGFALGDSNYPINPELRIVNNSTTTIPGGARRLPPRQADPAELAVDRARRFAELDIGHQAGPAIYAVAWTRWGRMVAWEAVRWPSCSAVGVCSARSRSACFVRCSGPGSGRMSPSAARSGRSTPRWWRASPSPR